MTLKEELETLRGEPIDVFAGDSMDVPCIETSDPDKLCKNPVVSVHMITYNHEPYIRQAIEGVIMQRTDFEFELVVGEDCSKDKTREICFEYQKKYPDKIRILWWHENVSKLGGNSRRVRAHCRGAFIALCEGDDYWIDPLKLQKQVDIMRKYPNVGICFCGSKIYNTKRGVWSQWNDGSWNSSCVIPCKEYMLYSMFGRNPYKIFGPEFFQMTATFLVRKSLLDKAVSLYELDQWRTRVGDGKISMGVGSLSDAYYLSDVVSVYRQTTTGATVYNAEMGMVDTLIIRLYFLKVIFGLDLYDAPDLIRRNFVRSACAYKQRVFGRRNACRYLCDMLKTKCGRRFFARSIWYAVFTALNWPIISRVVLGLLSRCEAYIHPLGISDELRQVYLEKAGIDLTKVDVRRK